LLGEEGKALSVLDRLDRLEALDFLPSALEWQEFRTIRDRLAHDDPEQPEELCLELEVGLQAGERLQQTWEHIYARMATNAHLAEFLNEGLKR
jgi:hypothetical protein